jgi:hypothetical protein
MIFSKNVMRSLSLLFLIVLLSSCSDSVTTSNNEVGSRIDAIIIPQTQQIDLTKFSKVIYVSSFETNENQNGTKENSYTTIKEAVDKLSGLSKDSQAAVLVSEGNYTSKTIDLKEYVHLYGGYDSETWTRDIEKYKTILTGDGESRILIAEDNTTIDGFTITGAKFRGKGAAVYCDGTSPVITNNTFENNMSLKPLDWNPEYWHETANDGGAIYCKDGASPVIKNNLFVNNKTENGRGGACAFDNNCNPQIINNTFYNNHTGLDDPMRSSDGGAVSIFRWCKGLVKGNLFLSNTADSHNDGGGLFVALWSSTVVKNNLFVDNESGDDGGALFVGGQEHRYDAPLDPYPPKDKFYVTVENNTFIGNRNSSMNSGAMRFTMESRGKFSNNIVAQNNGIYFQRSETEITGNLILDNMLVIETKEGLDKSVIADNIIWADFVLDETVAELNNNNMLYTDKFEGSKKAFPGFKDDGMRITVYSANFNKDKNYTELILNRNIKNLIGRIVKADGKWSVVKSFENKVLQLWGNFSAITEIQILPSYELIN